VLKRLLLIVLVLVGTVSGLQAAAADSASAVRVPAIRTSQPQPAHAVWQPKRYFGAGLWRRSRVHVDVFRRFSSSM
jgi:hypothetical protein